MMANPAITMKVDGLATLERRLKQFGPKLTKRGLRSSANSGIQVIKKEAQARAPYRTGRLAKKAIYVKRSKQSTQHTAVYMLGVRVGHKAVRKGIDAYYWFMQEFGTQKQAAQPFLRPAFEAKKFEALDRFARKLREFLDKVAAEK